MDNTAFNLHKIMKSCSKENSGLHEDLKPYMGDAMYTSSDSHETVGVTQPNSYKEIEFEKRLSYDPEVDLIKELNRERKFEPSSDLQMICDRLGSLYEKRFNRRALGFTYHEYVKTDFYVCFLSRTMLLRVSKDKLRFYQSKYLDNSTFYCAVKKYGNCVICVISERARSWKPQIGLSEITSSLYESIKTPIVLLSNVKSTVNTITSMTMRLLLIDLVSFLLSLRDGAFTGEKVIASMLSIYTMHYRLMECWGYKPQTSVTVTDLLLGLTALGLPTKVLEAVKNFTSITGKRIFESDFFISTTQKMFESLITIIEHLSTPIFGMSVVPESVTVALVKVIRKVGTTLFLHSDIKNICDLYSRYVTNPQHLFDPAFRSQIMNTYEKLKGDPAFLDYVSNSNNRYFKTTWDLFEANVVKSCKAFDTSGRKEPICFVFEGEAGSGKSAFMNSFVALLVRSGLTTYCHAVPAAEDGKDFYDDYENQDVFVMDDVGQQGKSQWRYLINYVSPVKYPLPCATASKKNTKFFNSKIIVCTTNHFSDLIGFTSSDCISEPEALFRRVHLIKVTRGNTPDFTQIFSYHKFDHIGSHRWEQGFINQHSLKDSKELETVFDTSRFSTIEDRTLASLTWMFRVYNHIQLCEKRVESVLNVSNQQLDMIINSVRSGEAQLFQSQSFNILRSLRYYFCISMDSVIDVVAIIDEYIGYLMHVIGSHVKSYMDMVKLFVEEEVPKFFQGCKNLNLSYLFGGIFGLTIVAFLGYALGSKQDVLSTPEFVQDNLDLSTYCLEKVKLLDIEIKSFYPQVDGNDSARDYNQRISELQSSCRTLVLREMSGMPEENTQCVVSGRRILIPAHMNVENRLVNIYRSWEHYKNKHVERENLRLKLVKSYFASDLAVYEITNPGPPPYRLTKIFDLYRTDVYDFKNLYLMNSTGYIRLDYNVHVKKNNETVSYSTSLGKWEHKPDSGFFTPFSAAGGCGTILVTPGHGVLGFHVAGSSNVGFCVRPPKQVFEDLVHVMKDTDHSDFDLDSKIIPNVSGVRIKYEGEIDQVRAISDTSFVKTPLHVDFCDDLKNLITDVEQSERLENPLLYTTVPKEKIDFKAPPNFRANGTPAKTMKAMEMKAFKHQGVISNDELEFMRKYLRSIMVKFTDVPDEEVAFGSPDLPPIASHSSNGIGAPGTKHDYFDFVKKEIKPLMYELKEKVRMDAINKTYDYRLFASRSAFKDELRKSNKVDTPRTIRVMPLGHTFWCKKIFGRLLKHFKDTRMKTGISVGFNPYKDADELAKKLLKCRTTADADFGKWDGSVMELVMTVIIETMGEFYTGDYPYMIEWLAATIASSFVLINDELWWTTHGLPSGCWLTLLINCLINKCLTALVIYRNKPHATVEDVHSVVDFVTGDDKIVGADGEMGDFFNLFTIKEVAESLGMDCTNGDKSPITEPSQPFEKLTYVKRHFRKHPVLKRYVGCLSLDTILNTIQWINVDTDDLQTAMNGKMRAMQVEAYLHSPLLYRRLTDLFIKYYPFEAFFTEPQVLKILDADSGYDLIQGLKNGNSNQ